MWASNPGGVKHNFARSTPDWVAIVQNILISVDTLLKLCMWSQMLSSQSRASTLKMDALSTDNKDTVRTYKTVFEMIDVRQSKKKE